ncbi:hypothetical protein TNCT_68281 [Trichonephila clavata]|uniref:Uncharacterized protein n=1 Tax=Trichonephila clavata TaxID=2740835 RepID=A0A8X6H7K5_TRICU|nr:hypothetical protein TNCT_68281 [Trichonephila clavata]
MSPILNLNFCPENSYVKTAKSRAIVRLLAEQLHRPSDRTTIFLYSKGMGYLRPSKRRRYYRSIYSPTPVTLSRGRCSECLPPTTANRGWL